MRVRVVVACAFAMLGCSASPAPVPVEAAPAAAPAPAPAAAPATPSPGTAATGVSAPPAPEPSEAPEPSAFPPADFAPPFERSAAPGDGRWTPLSASIPSLVGTVVHPHPASRFLSVHVVAADLSRLRLEWLPGTADVDPKTVPPALSVGVVPAAEQPRLRAVFNGGFQPKHGRWGIRTGEYVIMPPRDTGCTIALLADGGVRIAPWPALAGEAASFRGFRQTPPCLATAGELHPKLLANDEKPWGGNTKDVVTRRRSAIGIDAQRRVLYYAVGIEVGPRLLAEALRHAGASDSAELDINFNWTRFLLFEPGKEGQASRPLLPDMPFSRTGYVSRKNDRDFFYLLEAPAQTSD